MSSKNIDSYINLHKKQDKGLIDTYFPKSIQTDVLSVHKQLPEYHQTPLISLKNQAKNLKLGSILVKDESTRFGLNAFKALGATYAINKLLNEKLDNYFTYKDLDVPQIRAKLKAITLATTTDGNHGKGVAWVAQKLGCPAIIYMPKATIKARIKAIEKLGATVKVLDMNYDDTVKQMSHDAKLNNWTVISDTAWKNYTKIPTWIQQGYCTLFDETTTQLTPFKINHPTHIFIQAGVGALAAAAIGYYEQFFPNKKIKYIILEPTHAACLYYSAKSGKQLTINGSHKTIMAGLACGKPSDIAWPIIQSYASAFLACKDSNTKIGMKTLATPLGDDSKIISGESGGIGLGALIDIMTNKTLSKLKKQLQLNESSHILLINTEGATNPINYSKIIKSKI